MAERIHLQTGINRYDGIDLEDVGKCEFAYETIDGGQTIARLRMLSRINTTQQPKTYDGEHAEALWWYWTSTSKDVLTLYREEKKKATWHAPAWLRKEL